MIEYEIHWTASLKYLLIVIIRSVLKGDETFPILALNIKIPTDNVTTFYKQETFAFMILEKMLSN